MASFRPRGMDRTIVYGAPLFITTNELRKAIEESAKNDYEFGYVRKCSSDENIDKRISTFRIARCNKNSIGEEIKFRFLVLRYVMTGEDIIDTTDTIYCNGEFVQTKELGKEGNIVQIVRYKSGISLVYSSVSKYDTESYIKENGYLFSEGNSIRRLIDIQDCTNAKINDLFSIGKYIIPGCVVGNFKYSYFSDIYLLTVSSDRIDLSSILTYSRISNDSTNRLFHTDTRVCNEIVIQEEEGSINVDTFFVKIQTQEGSEQVWEI